MFAKQFVFECKSLNLSVNIGFFDRLFSKNAPPSSHFPAM
jgi:hypothetical protein